MSNSYYNFLGPIDNQSLFSTQEHYSDNQYMYYYQNSLSSFAYLIPSIYLLFKYSKYTKINVPIEDVIVQLNLFLLSFVSFLWWASQRQYIHNYDIVLYSNSIVLIGLFSLSKNKVISNKLFIGTFSVFIALMLYLIYVKNRNTIKLVNISSSVFSGYALIQNKYNDVFCIFIMSVIFKLLDTYFLNFDIYIMSGTAWFHTISAVGYLFLLMK